MIADACRDSRSARVGIRQRAMRQTDALPRGGLLLPDRAIESARSTPGPATMVCPGLSRALQLLDEQRLLRQDGLAGEDRAQRPEVRKTKRQGDCIVYLASARISHQLGDRSQFHKREGIEAGG